MDNGAVMPRRLVLTVVPVMAAVNVVLGILDKDVDSIGTAFAAFMVGPWWGAAVALIGGLIKGLTFQPIALASIPPNVVAAVLWGYGMRLGFGRTAPLIAIMAFFASGCSALVSAGVALAFFGGATPDGAGLPVVILASLGLPKVLATFLGICIVSGGAKVIAAAVAIVVLRIVAPALRWSLPMPSFWNRSAQM